MRVENDENIAGSYIVFTRSYGRITVMYIILFLSNETWS